MNFDINLAVTVLLILLEFCYGIHRSLLSTTEIGHLVSFVPNVDDYTRLYCTNPRILESFKLLPNGNIVVKRPIEFLKDRTFQLSVYRRDNILSQVINVTVHGPHSSESETDTQSTLDARVSETLPQGTCFSSLFVPLYLIDCHNVLFKLTDSGRNVTDFQIKSHCDVHGAHLTLCVARRLDFEERSLYRLTLSAINKDSINAKYIATLIVHVDNENDNKPQFLIKLYDLTFPNVRNQAIGQLHAEDPDGDPLQFEMASRHTPIQVDRDSGTIYLRRKHLWPGKEIYFVYAKDGKHRSYPALIRLHGNAYKTTRLRRRARRQTARLSPMRVELSESRSGSLFSLPTDGTKRFKFKSPAPKLFTLNEVTGEVRLRHLKQLDYEKQPEITFIVIVTSRIDHNCKLRVYILS